MNMNMSMKMDRPALVSFDRQPSPPAVWMRSCHMISRFTDPWRQGTRNAIQQSCWRFVSFWIWCRIPPHKGFYIQYSDWKVCPSHFSYRWLYNTIQSYHGRRYHGKIETLDSRVYTYLQFRQKKCWLTIIIQRAIGGIPATYTRCLVSS